MKTLQDAVRDMWELAKENLQRDGFLAPVVMFIPRTGPIEPVLLDMKRPEEQHRFVQERILSTRPQAVILISEGWMKKLNKEEMSQYHRGDAEKAPDRMEIITVVGGSIKGTFGIVQPFHRIDKRIVFEDVIEHTGIESAFFDDVWQKLQTH